MKSRAEPPTTLVVCISNDGYPASLELRRIYRLLLGDDAARDEDPRVVDDRNTAIPAA